MLDKQPDDISLADVEAFCNLQVPENSTLDYKRNLSQSNNKGLVKLVSAMANNHGGWIIIGVEEKGTDNQGRGLPGKILGVKKTEKLPERIKTACLQGIAPSVMPKIGVCELDAEHCVIIMKVDESESTPHELQDGRVYIRVDDVSHLADDGKEASVSDIQYLLNRRSKANLNKERLVERAKQRTSLNNYRYPSIACWCIPKFPNTPLCEYSRVADLGRVARNWGFYLDIRDWQTVNEGIFSSFYREILSGNDPHYGTAEINIFGGVHLSITAGKNDGNDNYDISMSLPLTLLCSTIKIADLFYRSCNYFGCLEIGLGLDCNNFGARLSNSPIKKSNSVDNAFEVMNQSEVHSLYRPETVDLLMKEFIWSAGYGTSSIHQSFHQEAKEQMREFDMTRVTLNV